MLGRVIRRSVRDQHFAEGLLILSIAILLIVMVVSFYVAWAFVQPIVETDPSGQSAIYYYLSQISAFSFLFLVAILGFKPSLKVSLQDGCLHIKQGKLKLLLLESEIVSAEPITALRFHRHYRKYAKTMAFFNRLSDRLLLLNTTKGPVILGLPERDQATLLRTLRSPATTENEISLEFVV